MKKKSFFSMLLLAAFCFAATSTVVSCKDYDDDIKGINTRIDQLDTDHKAQLEALKTALQKSIDENKKSIEDNKKAIERNQEVITQNVHEINELRQDLIDETNDRVAEIARLETRIKASEDAIAKINEILETKASKEELALAVKELRAEIDAIDKALTVRIDNLYSLVTSLDGRLTEVEGKLSTAEKNIVENAKAIAKNADDIAALDKSLDLQKEAFEAYKTEMAKTIEGLNAKDAEQAELIAALQKKLNEEVTRINKEIEAANKEIDAVKTDLASKNEAIWKKIDEMAEVDKSLKNQIDENTGKISANATAIAANAVAITAINKVLNNHSDSLTIAFGRIAQLKVDLQTANDKIDALKTYTEKAVSDLNGRCDDLQKQINAINDKLNVLANYSTNVLRALVTVPQYYYYGVQAIETGYYYYAPIVINEEAAISKEGETWIPTREQGLLSQDIWAEYHMNPSSYDYKNIKSLAFVSDDKAYQHSRTAACDPQIDSWDAANGVLKVKAYVNDAPQIKKVADDSQITVVALQATIKGYENDVEKDTTITSDYAALLANEYTDLAIVDIFTTDNMASDKRAIEPSEVCDLDGEWPGFHTWTVMKDAIYDTEGELVHKIVYDETIDLDSMVQAHWMKNADDQATMVYQAVSDKMLQDFHLEWNFAIAPYIDANDKKIGDKNYNNSSIAEGNIFTPTAKAVGETVIVRATLKNKDNNKIVSIGYIKFLVTSKRVEFDKTVEGFKSIVGLCNTRTTKEGVNFATIYEEVKNQLGKEVAFPSTAKEFLELYPTMTQTEKYGKVSQAGDASTAAKLYWNWTLTGADVQELVWDEKNQKYNPGQKATVTVTFTSTKPTVYPEIVVKFISEPLETPEVASIEKKIKNYWYATNATEGGSGFDAIHANVQVIKEEKGFWGELIPLNGNPLHDWTADILSTFEQNDVELVVKGSINNEAFDRKNLNEKFVFVKQDTKKRKGESDAEYTLEANEDGDQVYAIDAAGKKYLIAFLSTDRGAKVSNNMVYICHNDVAMDLLNAASHEQIANSLTLKIGIKAATKTECQDPLPVPQTFDVVFLRPINAQGKNYDATDALTGGNQIKLADFMSFTDWRELWGDTDPKATNAEYMKFYGIHKITIDTEKIMTDLNQEPDVWKPLINVTKNIIITQHPANGAVTWNPVTGDFDLGYLEYQNNGMTVSDFKLKVPLTVHYTWGHYTAKEAIINIGGTVGPNAAPRK